MIDNNSVLSCSKEQYRIPTEENKTIIYFPETLGLMEANRAVVTVLDLLRRLRQNTIIIHQAQTDIYESDGYFSCEDGYIQKST